MKGRIDGPLVLLLTLGLGLHALVALGNLEGPYGATPINDAQYYWEWGGRVARGELVGDAPFFAAPLYPYLLGLLRALGCGLTGVLVTQLLLHVATAGLLERVGTGLADRRVGLLAAGLWLLLTDPAASHGRVLAGTLQAFLLAVLLERALALHRRPDLARALGLGLLAGLASLAWPALLPACLLLAAWAWRVGAGARGAAAVLVVAGLAVAPATWHNHAASGAFIPISAHAGLTFWHGNNPSANGVFAPHEVSPNKQDHHLDALEQTRAARGPDAGWGDVSPYFLHKGLAWWAAEPGRALLLAGKKAWLFGSARVYGDMYLPTLERDAGMWTSLWLAPLPAAWIVLPALVAAALLLRRDPRRFAPAALLLLLPFAICCVFWYSPRYRLPALPAAAVLSAWAVVELWARRGPAPLLAGAALLAVGSPWINRAAGVDPRGDLALEVELRGALLHVQAGQRAPARRLFERVLARRPADALAAQDLAWILATAPEDDLRDGARALELATDLDRRFQGRNPRVLDVLAAALAETGDTQQAVEVALWAARQFRAVGAEQEARAVEARLLLYREGRPFRQP